MVLMNLFAGKEWRLRCREGTCRYSERKSRMNGESSDIQTLSCTKQIVGEKLLRTQEAQPGAL